MEQLPLSICGVQSAGRGTPDNEPWMRKCVTCGVEKDISLFPFNSAKCRDCERERQRIAAAQRRAQKVNRPVAPVPGSDEESDAPVEEKSRQTPLGEQRAATDEPCHEQTPSNRDEKRRARDRAKYHRRKARDPSFLAKRAQYQRRYRENGELREHEREGARRWQHEHRDHLRQLARISRAQWNDGISRVYFVLSVELGRIKIGFSARRPEYRVKTMQTGSADELRLLGWIPGAQVDETRLHDRFRSLRVTREWFRAELELLNYIERHAVKPDDKA